MDRRLAAILALDMVSYSRLMEADEEGTLSRQRAHLHELINPAIDKHRGRVVKTTGDGLLAEFPSAVDAMVCAAEIQRGMPERETGVDDDRRIMFRIGLNVGDIVFEDGDIYGDGVNVAARIEPLADSGGICISQTVFNAVRNKVDVGFEDVGAQDLKNISEPVQVYRVLLDPESVGKLSTGRLKKPTPIWRQPTYIAAAAIIVVLGGGLALRDAFIGLPTGGVRRIGAGALEPGGAGDTRSIAVLYLEDRTAGGQLGYVADGLTEALIDELSAVPGLNVVSQNGSLQFKGSDLPRDSIARALKAGTVVTGSVDATGDRIRVNVAVTDGESGEEFNRGTFQQPRDSIFELQSELASQVSGLLRAWLGEELETRTIARETESVAAWAMMQRGERARKEADDLLDQGDLDQAFPLLQRCDSLLAEAEALDPTWPRPSVLRAKVAMTLAQVAAPGPLEVKAYIDAGIGHVERALALDGRNAFALETRGVMRYVEWRMGVETDPTAAQRLFDGGEEDLKTATRLDPSRAYAWNILSMVYSDKPDQVGAKIAARTAYEEDAFLRGADDLLWRLYATSYDLEQFPDAISYCAEGRRRFPEFYRFVECELWLLASRAMEPDVDRAWELDAQIEGMLPSQGEEYTRLKERILVGAVLARAQLTDSAHAVWEASRGNPEIDPPRDLLALEAVFRLQAGEEEEALNLVRTYLTLNPEHRSGWTWTSHWWWRGLQDNQEFKDLLGAGGG